MIWMQKYSTLQGLAFFFKVAVSHGHWLMGKVILVTFFEDIDEKFVFHLIDLFANKES